MISSSVFQFCASLRASYNPVRLLSRQLSFSRRTCQKLSPGGKTKESTTKPVPEEPLSALYVDGITAQHTPFIVEPFLNYDEYFAKSEQLQSEINLRGIKLNVKTLHERYLQMRQIASELKTLDEEKFRVAVLQSQLTEETRQEGIRLREKRNEIMGRMRLIETPVALELLKIPVWLHRRTPTDGKHKLVFESSTETTSRTNRSSEINEKLFDFLEYSDCSPNGYFLKGKAVEIEQELQYSTSQKLNSLGFSLFSAPHLVKSVVLEASGSNLLDPSAAFMVDTTLHGSFGSEFRSFFLNSDPLHNYSTYFMHGELKENSSPLKLYHIGRIYRPRSPLPHDIRRLIYPLQTNCLSFGVAFENPLDSDKITEELFEFMRGIYGEIFDKFRVISIPANQLKGHESLRYVFEVLCESQEEFVPVGYISVNGDSISRRVRFHLGKHDDKFVNLIHGSVMDVTPAVILHLQTGKNISNEPRRAASKSTCMPAAKEAQQSARECKVETSPRPSLSAKQEAANQNASGSERPDRQRLESLKALSEAEKANLQRLLMIDGVDEFLNHARGSQGASMLVGDDADKVAEIKQLTVDQYDEIFMPEEFRRKFALFRQDLAAEKERSRSQDGTSGPIKHAATQEPEIGSKDVNDGIRQQSNKKYKSRDAEVKSDVQVLGYTSNVVLSMWNCVNIQGVIHLFNHVLLCHEIDFRDGCLPGSDAYAESLKTPFFERFWHHLKDHGFKVLGADSSTPDLHELENVAEDFYFINEVFVEKGLWRGLRMPSNSKLDSTIHVTRSICLDHQEKRLLRAICDYFNLQHD